MGGKKISALIESTTVPSNSYTIIVDGTVNKKIKLETITKDLSDKVTDLENELSVNTNKVNEQGTTITNLSNKVNAQEIVTNSLSDRVNEVNEQLDNIESDIKYLGSIIASSFNTLNDAIDYALLNNFNKVSLGENIYEVTEPIIINNSIELIGNGAIIKQMSDIPLITVNGQYEYNKNVTEIVNTSLDISEENGGATMLTRLKVVDNSKMKVGDVVYLYNIDFSLYEFSTISHIDNNYIYLSNTLRNTYTNINIAKPTTTFKLSGINFDTVNATETYKERYLILNNLINPLIENVSIIKASNSVINLNYCYNYIVSNCNINNVRNRITDQISPNVGYGVNDGGSTNGKISNCNFTNVRHGVTTNGLTYNLNVINCNAFNCGGAGFDTHSYADKIKFVNCNVYGSYRGNRSDGTAFQNRGNNVEFINCNADNCFKGFYLFEEHNNTYIENCKLTNIYYGSVDTSNTTLRNVKINNCYFEVLNKDYVISLNGIKGEIIDTTLKNKCSNTTPSNYRCIVASESDVTLTNCILDMSEYKGTKGRFLTGNTNSYIKGYDLVCLQGIANLNNFITGDKSENLVIELKNVKGDFTVDGVYNVTKPILDFESTAVNYSIINHTVGAVGTTTNFALPYKNCDTIIYNVTVTNSGASLRNFGKGNFIGQKLLIKNVSAESLIVENVGNNILMSSNKTITQNQALLLIYDGTNWIGL